MDYLEEVCCNLFNIEAIKFGKFMLKNGLESPIYFDLRVVVSYPKLMNTIAKIMWERAENSRTAQDLICGVPYTALPIATCICINNNIPMVLRRKEAKSYGTKQLIEGSYKAGQKCLIIEDVVTVGSSVLETANVLRSLGMDVTDCIVLLDREQGGRENLQKENITLHSVYTMSSLLSMLNTYKKIDSSTIDNIRKFIDSNNRLLPPPELITRKNVISYGERAKLCNNAVSKRLFEIMEIKKTNLCVAVDVTTSTELLSLAEKIGSEICVLKTHIDILDDFSLDIIKKLKEISQRKNFLLFEDRKYADIGNTVQHQYTAGIYKSRDWADLITVHHFPGPGIIEALKQIADKKQNGCLIVAEMSSKNSFTTKKYAEEAAKLAVKHPDFVVGLISQSHLLFDPTFLHFTPGVKIEKGSDQLDQKYMTPESAINHRGTDVVIVGRGITNAENPFDAAALYRRTSYETYLKLLESS